MATATRSRRTDSAKIASDAPPAPETTDVNLGTAPDALQNAVNPGPSLQDALNAPAPVVNVVAPAGDANTVAFLDVCARLDETIKRQKRVLVGYFAERGALVAEGVNVKVAKGRNQATRKELRAASLRALELAALGAYDPDSEPQPKLDRWLTIHHLVAMFPRAKDLPSVGVADRVGTLLTRVDPPRAWDAPEEWELKRKYAPADVRALIERIITEDMTIEQTDAEIATLDGVVNVDAPKAKTEDPIKAARQLAATIMERISDRKVDPETLFDELQSQLAKYGWQLVKGNAPNGAPTLKPVKVTR